MRRGVWGRMLLCLEDIQGRTVKCLPFLLFFYNTDLPGSMATLFSRAVFKCHFSLRETRNSNWWLIIYSLNQKLYLQMHDRAASAFLMFLLYCAENVTWDLHSKIFKCRTQHCWVQAQGCKQISKRNSFSNRNLLAYYSSNKLCPFLSPWRHHCLLWVLWLMRRNSSCAWHHTHLSAHSAHHNSSLLSRVIKILLHVLWHIFFWLLLL